MLIEKDSTANVDWNLVAELFDAVGWGRRDPAELSTAFSKSSHVIFLYQGDELMGLGRAVDDGRYYASIVDVIVRPGYQKRGIGTTIVRRLQERVSGYLLVSITAADEVRPFYERLGWKPQRTAMILPRDLRQEELNCTIDDADLGESPVPEHLSSSETSR